jgi:MFS family permease
VLYERIPDHLRARTLGAVKASAWIGTPIGPLLAGFLVEDAGLRTALFAFAMIFVVATVVPLVLPVMRDMNRTPRAGTPAARDGVAENAAHGGVVPESA